MGKIFSYKNSIDWREELDVLSKMDVKVYGVHVGKEDSAEPFYQELAEKSNGQYLSLDQFQSMNEIFMGICYAEATDKQLKMQNQLLKVGKNEAHVFFNEELEESRFTNEEMLQIHEAIHDLTSKDVLIGGNRFAISSGKAGCRMTRIKGK